jgi:hypothetical protein
LAPTVGIVVTGFCYPGGIFQLFHRQDQQFFAAADSSSNQIASALFIIFEDQIIIV